MQLEPYLFFDGTCEEALNYYKGIFGGEIVGLTRYKDAPMDQQLQGAENRVMHASFKADGVNFMASDARPGTQYGEGPMSLSISGTDLDEAQRVFDALAAGGNVEMPFQDTFWGARFGMLKDKYGIDWMVNCALAPEGAATR